MTGVVKAVAHGASPRQNHAGYLPTRAISNMAGTSTPYEPGGPGRRARITSHDSMPGAQQHQEATPGRGAAAQDQLKLNGIAYEQRGWDIHALCAGRDRERTGTGITQGDSVTPIIDQSCNGSPPNNNDKVHLAKMVYTKKIFRNFSGCVMT